MKREFAAALRCPFCRGPLGGLREDACDEREVREGEIGCAGCARRFPIRGGIVHLIDPEDRTIAREVAGWERMAGPLGGGLEPVMTALPWYPHRPWPETAPDFFQIFEEVDFAGRRVVDIGAGRTWSSRFLATIGRAAEVVAVDVLTKRFLGLETADVFFAEDRSFFERLCADAHHLPLADGWADAVFSAAAIHHSSDLDGLFREIARVLRPGGILAFVSEPVKKASEPARRPDNAEVAAGINEHVYSWDEYASALRRQGFRLRRLMPRSISYRLLYPDDDFLRGLPPPLRRLRTTARGRRLVERLVASRLTGSLVYRASFLPLSVVATKKGDGAKPGAA